MTFGKRYIAPIFLYLIVILLGFVLMFVPSYLLPLLYDTLSRMAPDTFPDISPISQPDEYKVFSMWIMLISVFIVLLVLNYVALRLDNKRFEYVISLTDGLYTMPEGLLLYVKNFLISDVIAALIVPPIIIIPAYFIPMELLDKGLSIPFWLGCETMPYFDFITATLIAVVISIISRICIIYPTVKVWRAMWLTASVE